MLLSERSATDDKPENQMEEKNESHNITIEMLLLLGLIIIMIILVIINMIMLWSEWGNYVYILGEELVVYCLNGVRFSIPGGGEVFIQMKFLHHPSSMLVAGAAQIQGQLFTSSTSEVKYILWGKLYLRRPSPLERLTTHLQHFWLCRRDLIHCE